MTAAIVNKSLKDGSGAPFNQAVLDRNGDGSSLAMAAVLLDATGQTPITPLKAGDPIDPTNFNASFKDEFVSYTPGLNWVQVLGSNDIVRLDGNAAAASYLVISKDPLTQGSVTTITSTFTAKLPIEFSFGLSMSQRTWGQEFACEAVSNDQPIAAFVDATFTTMSQALSVLTATTTAPHQLSVGDAIAIYGVNDSRFNYPSLVVATIPTPTQFTAQAGPNGALPSLTAGPFTTGSVTKRPRLGLAESGASMIFEMTTATNAAFYVAGNGGETVASGTMAGSHESLAGTTASVQQVNAAYSYAFAPSTEYHLNLMPDRTQWSDTTVDAVSQTTARMTRTQINPSIAKSYNLRFRATNNPSLTVPVAQVISAVKTGTTAATITTDVAHGLTTADFIVQYGANDQVNFPNLLVATAVASVIDATHYTVVVGAAVTATTHGGFVARVNGGNLGSALGYSAVVAVDALVTTSGDGTTVLQLTGNTTWAGLLIGDYVNVLGLRENVAGASLGCDGPWMVRNFVGSFLELGPIGNTVPPANFANTACGGGIIKRTDLRISFARAFDFDRLRVEALPRPVNDMSAAMPVAIQNVPTVTLSAGAAQFGAVNLGIPLTVADIASAAITATTTTATIIPAAGVSYEVNIPVTAVSGTNPTMDIEIQESDDTGTNWFTVYDFPRITATGMYRSPKLPLTGNRLRYLETIGGTTPSFTRSLNRLQSSDVAPAFRQMIDRSIVLTTANSVTPWLDTKNALNQQMVVNIGAATTPPSLQMEGSDDNGLTVYSIGNEFDLVANTTQVMVNKNQNASLIRARVSTVGVAVTAGYVMLRAFS